MSIEGRAGVDPKLWNCDWLNLASECSFLEDSSASAATTFRGAVHGLLAEPSLGMPLEFHVRQPHLTKHLHDFGRDLWSRFRIR
jgi:hypothetical protein